MWQKVLLKYLPRRNACLVHSFRPSHPKGVTSQPLVAWLGVSLQQDGAGGSVAVGAGSQPWAASRSRCSSTELVLQPLCFSTWAALLRIGPVLLRWKTQREERGNNTQLLILWCSVSGGVCIIGAVPGCVLPAPANLVAVDHLLVLEVQSLCFISHCFRYVGFV